MSGEKAHNRITHRKCVYVNMYRPTSNIQTVNVGSTLSHCNEFHFHVPGLPSSLHQPPSNDGQSGWVLVVSDGARSAFDLSPLKRKE